MKRESLVAVYTLVGGALGAAIAVALPIWTVFWTDAGEHMPLWDAFGSGSELSRYPDTYFFPLSVAVILIGVGLFVGRKLGKGVAVGMVQHGYCKSCGYNLTGNGSGVCPECGTSTP